MSSIILSIYEILNRNNTILIDKNPFYISDINYNIKLKYNYNIKLLTN